MWIVSGTVLVWPDSVTAIRNPMRKAAVRGATRGNEMLPCFKIVTFVPGRAASRVNTCARQGARAGLT